MIKAIVLDIDGVVVGNLEGVNFPNPSINIQNALHQIMKSGISISFLTAKPSFAAQKNIEALNINSPHVATNGAVIFNPVEKTIIEITPLETESINEILDLLPKHIYISLFATNEYFLQKHQISEITKKYSSIVDKKPTIVNDFKNVLNKEAITKLNITASTSDDHAIIENVFSQLKNKVDYTWGTHPYIFPIQILNVTKKGVSKKMGVEKLSQYMQVPLENILGVGDTMLDWAFLNICGYKGTMKNGTPELVAKFDFTDPKQFMGNHVNEDGLIDVFRYFKLI